MSEYHSKVERLRQRATQEQSDEAQRQAAAREAELRLMHRRKAFNERVSGLVETAVNVTKLKYKLSGAAELFLTRSRDNIITVEFRPSVKKIPPSTLLIKLDEASGEMKGSMSFSGSPSAPGDLGMIEGFDNFVSTRLIEDFVHRALDQADRAT